MRMSAVLAVVSSELGVRWWPEMGEGSWPGELARSVWTESLLLFAIALQVGSAKNRFKPTTCQVFYSTDILYLRARTGASSFVKDETNGVP